MDEKERSCTVEDLERVIDAAAEEIADRDQQIEELKEKVVMLGRDSKELDNLRKLYLITKDELGLLKDENARLRALEKQDTDREGGGQDG